MAKILLAQDSLGKIDRDTDVLQGSKIIFGRSSDKISDGLSFGSDIVLWRKSRNLETSPIPSVAPVAYTYWWNKSNLGQLTAYVASTNLQPTNRRERWKALYSKNWERHWRTMFWNIIWESIWIDYSNDFRIETVYEFLTRMVFKVWLGVDFVSLVLSVFGISCFG